MLAWTHPAFDSPVILFQDVLKILHRAMSTLLFQHSASFELNGEGSRSSHRWSPRPGTSTPIAFHPHVRLVHPPRVVCGLEPFAQPPIQLRGLRWTQRQTVT